MDALTRTLPPTRRTLGDVDLANPLDTTHTLLDGVQGFWLPLPRLVGGSRLYDLSAHSNHGDLINAEPSIDWASSASRRLPFLDLEGAGTSGSVDDHISIPQTATSNSPLSILVLVRLDSLSTFHGIIGKGRDNGAWGMHTEAGNKIVVNVNTSFVRTSKVSESVWHQLGFTISPSNETTGYVDGDSFGTFTNSFPGNSLPILIGSLNSSSGAQYSGDIAVQSVIIYDREISSSEVSFLNQQARRGFPDLLRRRDSVGLLGGGGGGTTAIVVNSDFSGRAGTVGSDLAVKQALQSTLSGAVGTVGSDVAVRQALESTLSGAPGTLSATTRALPSITTDLQGNQGTFASGIASIAAVEAAMTGRPGSLTSQAAVLQALNAGLSGQAGTLNIQLSTSQLTSAQVDISGAKGSLSSTLAARLALQSALQGASGTISAEVGIPLSLDADFAGARGDLVATLGGFRTLDATLEGRPGTLSVAAEVIQRLQATLQGAAGDSTAVARVTQAVSASLEGRPGQLTSILGDIGALATIDARLRDELKIDAILDDALSIDADLTD